MDNITDEEETLKCHRETCSILFYKLEPSAANWHFVCRKCSRKFTSRYSERKKLLAQGIHQNSLWLFSEKNG